MIDWLHEVASHLSAETATTWIVAEHEHRGWVLRRVRIDGGELHVAPPTGYAARAKRDTHMRFVARWPRDAQGYERSPWYERTIERTVAVSRPAATVAREVARHVVRPWEPLYSERWGVVSREREQIRDANEIVNELVALGATRLDDRGGCPHIIVAGIEITWQHGSAYLPHASLSRGLAAHLARAALAYVAAESAGAPTK